MNFLCHAVTALRSHSLLCPLSAILISWTFSAMLSLLWEVILCCFHCLLSSYHKLSLPCCHCFEKSFQRMITVSTVCYPHYANQVICCCFQSTLQSLYIIYTLSLVASLIWTFGIYVQLTQRQSNVLGLLFYQSQLITWLTQRQSNVLGLLFYQSQLIK